MNPNTVLLMGLKSTFLSFFKGKSLMGKSEGCYPSLVVGMLSKLVDIE